MISNKAVVTLTLITLSIKYVASTSSSDPSNTGLVASLFSQIKKCVSRCRTRKTTTSSPDTSDTLSLAGVQEEDNEFPDDTRRSRSPCKSILTQRRGHKAIAMRNVLQDNDNQVTDVPAAGGTPVQVDHVGEQSVSVINERFKRLIKQENYEKIREQIITMDKDEFIAQICLVVKTHEQYGKLKYFFECNEMVEHFYVYGDMTVVKDAIITIDNSFDDGRQSEELQNAIELALERDKHERVCELLKARQDGTAETDKNCQNGSITSFETFMTDLFFVLAPWKNVKPLSRFITFHGKEFRDKYPDIHAIFCERLVDVTYSHCSLFYRTDNENAKKLLNDLVGQPSFLTAVTLSQALLYYGNDFWRTGFIEYGWQEAIKEGLNGKYLGGGKHLWDAIKRKYPEQHFGDFPPSDEALGAVLKLFPTKQKLEEAWAEAHAPILLKKFESLGLFPTVLWILISQYALSWSDVCQNRIDVI